MTVSNYCVTCATRFKTNESYVVQLNCGHMFHLVCLISCPICHICPVCKVEYVSLPIHISCDYVAPDSVQDPKLNYNMLRKLMDILEAKNKRDGIINELKNELLETGLQILNQQMLNF